MDKKWLIIPIMLSLLTIGVLSQTESFQKSIEPIISDKIQVCYSYKLEDPKSKVATTFNMCRKYPQDLTNKCKYNRYGKEIKCENILIKEIGLDMKNWYNKRLPMEIKKDLDLKDLTVTNADGDASSLEGKKWDFINEEFK